MASVLDAYKQIQEQADATVAATEQSGQIVIQVGAATCAAQAGRPASAGPSVLRNSCVFPGQRPG